MPLEKTEREIPTFVQFYEKGREKVNSYSLLMCNGNSIKVVCEPGAYSDEKVIDFEYSEPIHSLEVYENYVKVNGNQIIMSTEKSYATPSISNFTNVVNIDRINSPCIQENDFIQNENGCFCISGLSEEERLKLYEENGFTKQYENLKRIIEKREEEREAERRERQESIEKLSEYIDGKVLSICNVSRKTRYNSGNWN